MDHGKQTVEKKQNKKKQIYADFNVLQNFCFFLSKETDSSGNCIQITILILFIAFQN